MESRFLEPVFVSSGGSRNLVSTACGYCKAAEVFAMVPEVPLMCDVVAVVTHFSFTKFSHVDCFCYVILGKAGKQTA